MLNQVHSAQERWGGVNKLIDTWLNRRQELIVQFYELSSCKPLCIDSQPLAERIQGFCQSMMDYCSAGHFEIYEQLMAEAREFEDGSLEYAESVVPVLDRLTGRCVDFNDLYDKDCPFEALASLPTELSGLGETLEERFQLEDQLIERLHTAHGERINAGQTQLA